MPPSQNQTWHIHPVPPTAPSLHAWTETQYSAFTGTGNTLADTLFPANDISGTASRHLAEIQSDSAGAGGAGAIDTVQIVDERTGEIVGGAQFAFYTEDPGREEGVVVDWVGGEGSRERKYAQMVMDSFNGVRVRRMKGAHALIKLLFTSPNHERQGVAKALIQCSNQKADALGLKTYVEASPRGQPVYRREGFADVEGYNLTWEEFPEKEPIVWYMMERMPQRCK